MRHTLKCPYEAMCYIPNGGIHTDHRRLSPVKLRLLPVQLLQFDKYGNPNITTLNGVSTGNYEVSPYPDFTSLLKVRNLHVFAPTAFLHFSK